MSRIAQLRQSLSSVVSATGFLLPVTRREWAELLRAYKYDRYRSPSRLSVREMHREERIAMAHREYAWTGYGWVDYDCP
jgi:hypothetical protein